ncbi:hypothetical protein SAMN05216321_1263 [Cupriavidus sp. OV038]|jgi:hypothetical protein|uniref:hypothetical protein n=1 Tax=unclassified Cupriavidus TaxID=2640874 RepID=UPI0008F22FBA|nr:MULTISPECIES: hypothetical protein [unclassified Cupriavidus]SFD49794.1 hypothetical protein SAMN05216321_1263 [Cupriavidus sp. OV038]SFQ18526.1 hypothetical protein SAMN05216322_1252 [Cupriavidus sp. OV096]
MNQHRNTFADYMATLRFIAHSVCIHGMSRGRLSESDGDGRFLAFFSRAFLRERRWAVIPLWEGDLRSLQTERGEQIELLARLRVFCMQNQSNVLNVATLEKAEWEYAPDFSAVTVATRKLDLAVDNPNQLFETTPNNLPYWGSTFLWPDNERFMVYTDGDNVSFIAGDGVEIEDLLGVSYAYCAERFVSSNIANQTQPDLINAFLKFCAEFE